MPKQSLSQKVFLKMKSVLGYAIGYLIVFYFISIAPMTLYYTWNDFKTHDSLFRLVFISGWVGAFKATHWPYYEFSFSKKHVDLTTLEDSLSRIGNVFRASNSLTKLGDAPDPLDSNQVKTAIKLIDGAISDLEKCDIDTLDEVQPGLGSILVTKHIESFSLRKKLITKFKLNGPQEATLNNANEFLKTSAQIDALDSEIALWMVNNLATVMSTLEEKYPTIVNKMEKPPSARRETE